MCDPALEFVHGPRMWLVRHTIEALILDELADVEAILDRLDALLGC
jgi:hypothetical protein